MQYHHLVMRLCLVTVGLCAADASLAATPGEQDLIRDRQDRLLQEQQRRLDDLRDLPGQQSSPAPVPAAPDTVKTFDNWVDAVRRGKPLNSPERKPATKEDSELARLRAEVAELKMEGEILKKAAVFFAKDSR
ncbi:transposase [Pseudomonas sp. SMSB3]|uniref:transposase n=1 Tax=unclassified Pseudomonas TaxID=196821 RepID=UPI00391836EA